MRPGKRLENGLRKVMARRLFGADARLHTLPFDRNTGSVNRARRCIRHLRTDAVAGDQRNLVRHLSSIRTLSYQIMTAVSFRLRTAKGKLKIEHSILDDLRPVLDRLVERDDIRS